MPVTESMENHRIGAKIAQLRETRGMTTVELAEKIGISQPQISRLENGKQGFRAETLIKIASALDVNAGYFFQDNGGEPRVSPQAEEALQRPEFVDFLDRLAGRYLVDPSVLPALDRQLER